VQTNGRGDCITSRDNAVGNKTKWQVTTESEAQYSDGVGRLNVSPDVHHYLMLSFLSDV